MPRLYTFLFILFTFLFPEVQAARKTTDFFGERGRPALRKPEKIFKVLTPAGTQSWEYNNFGGVKKWKLEGVTQFDIQQTDLLERPTEIEDFSGIRTIQYDNGKWTLDTVEWTSGLLEGFKLDEDADSRGRLGDLTFSKSGTQYYKVTHNYRNESQHLDSMDILMDGTSIEIDITGPGGKADALTYKIGGQPTFSYNRTRNANGRLNSITAPNFSQSWTLDAMGRKQTITTNGTSTTYGYNATNGSLASAGTRSYTFTNRGELTEEIVDNHTLAFLQDPNQSGAISSRENLREFTLFGSFNTNAAVNILVGTNVVYNTATTPFNYTFNTSNLPALIDSRRQRM